MNGQWSGACVIGSNGKILSCDVLEPLPFMDREILRWLFASTFRPATRNGEPVAVLYVFHIQIRGPL